MIQKIKNLFRKTHYLVKQGLYVRGDTPSDGYGNRMIEPDENRDFAFRRLTQQTVNNMTVSEALRCLIKTNATLDAIVDIHQSFTVREWKLTAKAEEGAAGEMAKEQMETYIENAFMGYRSFRGFLKQMAYYRIVEGGIAIRVTYDPETMYPKLELCPPFSLVYYHLKENGRTYLIIGKKTKRHSEIEVYYDERRSDNENMDFVYVPCNLRGNQVFGSSQLATALRPAYNRQKLSEQLADYLEKRIYPKNFYSIDLRNLFTSGVTLKDINEFAKEGTKALKKELSRLDDPDNQQDAVSSAPIEVTELTGVSKSQLDGSDSIMDVIEPEIQRAARIPRILLGGQRNRISLNQNDSEIEMTAFAIRNEDAAADLNEALTRAFIPIRRFFGIDAWVGMDVSPDNIIFDKIHAEIIDKKVDVYSKAKDAGFITAAEGRMKLKETSLDFSDLEGTLPEMDMDMEADTEPEPDSEDEDI